MEENVFRLRDATEADLPAITAIYNQAVRDGGATADVREQSIRERGTWLREHQASKRHPVIVAEYDGPEDASCVAAFASLSRFRSMPGYQEDAEISYYVGRKFRGRGLGRRLLRRLLNEGTARGVCTAVAVIFAGNAASTALVREFGFTRFGLLPAGAYDATRTVHDVAWWYRVL